MGQGCALLWLFRNFHIIPQWLIQSGLKNQGRKHPTKPGKKQIPATVAVSVGVVQRLSSGLGSDEFQVLHKRRICMHKATYFAVFEPSQDGLGSISPIFRDV